MNKIFIHPKVLLFYHSLDKDFVNRILETICERALLLYLQRGFEQNNGILKIHPEFDNVFCRTSSSIGVGGFTWSNTIEGREFWEDVLSTKMFPKDYNSKLLNSTSVFESEYPHSIIETEIEEYGTD